MCERIKKLSCVPVAWIACDPLALGEGARGICAPGMQQELCVAAGAGLQPCGTPSPKSRAGLVTVAGVSSQSGQRLADKCPVRMSRLWLGSGLGSGLAPVWGNVAQADSTGTS